MEIQNPALVLEKTFYKIATADGIVYWTHCLGNDGYMVVYPDGATHHTYVYPREFIIGVS